jgi:uncharacterized BrkB/YihY/UPF0761 family membrane protein
MNTHKYPEPGPSARLTYFTILSVFGLIAGVVCILAWFGAAALVLRLFRGAL